jgi:hypothetical protein
MPGAWRTARPARADAITGEVKISGVELSISWLVVRLSA